MRGDAGGAQVNALATTAPTRLVGSASTLGFNYATAGGVGSLIVTGETSPAAPPSVRSRATAVASTSMPPPLPAPTPPAPEPPALSPGALAALIIFVVLFVLVSFAAVYFFGKIRAIVRAARRRGHGAVVPTRARGVRSKTSTSTRPTPRGT